MEFKTTLSAVIISLICYLGYVESFMIAKVIFIILFTIFSILWLFLAIFAGYVLLFPTDMKIKADQNRVKDLKWYNYLGSLTVILFNYFCIDYSSPVFAAWYMVMNIIGVAACGVLINFAVRNTYNECE